LTAFYEADGDIAALYHYNKAGKILTYEGWLDGQHVKMTFDGKQVLTAQRITGNAKGNVYQGGDETTTLDGNDGNDILNGGGGSDTLRGGNDNDKLSGELDADQLFGEVGDDVLSGGDGNDLLDGGDGRDQLSGGAGDDVLIGGPATDFADGGAGSDTIVLSGRLTDYEIRFNAALNRYAIIDKRAGSPDGTDFADIEIFRFSDGQFTVANLSYLIAADSAIGYDLPNGDGSRSKISWVVSPEDPTKWDEKR
jgi:Ca2+-binding RTX toxin-like protein